MRGFLGRLLADEADESPPGPLDDFWYREFGATPRGGSQITADSATSIAAVFRCVAVLSEAVAQLPLRVYRKGLKGKTEETGPISSLLGRWPNEWQTSFEFRELLTAQALLRGKGLARIIPGPLGAPIGSLVPLHPDRVREEQLGNRRMLYILTKPGGGEERITQDEMFVLRGPAHAPDGIVSAARKSLGLTMASDDFGSDQFQHRPQHTGVIELPGTLKDKAASKRMAESFVASSRNRFLPAVLEVGAKFNATVGMNMVDAQWLEGRGFQVVEVCRWFGVPPHKVGHLTGSTFASVEQLSIEFVRDAVTPWAVRWEQCVDRDLLMDEAQFVEHDLERLLRGDTAARYGAYRVALGGMAFMSPNEVRERENLPRGDASLDEIRQPLNTAPGSDPKKEPNLDPGAPNA